MSLKKYTAAIITCWFGPYPWYFPYFIHSCSYNPTIDFIIITNSKKQIPNKSDNVKVINKSLEEIKNIASEKLGFPVNLDYAYKLCEFKPTYGFLFPEIIKDYDFWGSGDIDMILGNIREFFTDEMLDTYDFISLRHDYATGCLSLYRNNEQMNTFFMRSKDYQYVFSSRDYHNLDECGFAFEELREGISIFETNSKIESLTHIVKAADLKGEIKAHFDFIMIEGDPGDITFDNGRILYKNEFEAILYHLVTYKKKCIVPEKIGKIPSYYTISPISIDHPKDQKRIAKLKLLEVSHI